MRLTQAPSPLLRRLAITALAAAAILTVSATLGCAPGIGAEPKHQSNASNKGFEDQLLGRWLPQKPANQNAFVEFGVESTYFASDGCNTASGGWKFEADGTFFASGNGGTQIGCDNVPIPEAVAAATTISFDDKNTLVLSDGAGSTMRLFRTESETMTIVGLWAGPNWEATAPRIEFAADGTWIGYIGCHVYRGEWTIRIANENRVQAAEVGSGEPDTWFWSRGTPLLSIGPEPTEKRPECFEPGPSVLPVFPLNYSTDYVLSMTPGRFWAIPIAEAGAESIDSAAPGQRPIEFTKATEALPEPQ